MLRGCRLQDGRPVRLPGELRGREHVRSRQLPDRQRLWKGALLLALERGLPWLSLTGWLGDRVLLSHGQGHLRRRRGLHDADASTAVSLRLRDGGLALLRFSR